MRRCRPRRKSSSPTFSRLKFTDTNTKTLEKHTDFGVPQQQFVVKIADGPLIATPKFAESAFRPQRARSRPKWSNPLPTLTDRHKPPPSATVLPNSPARPTIRPTPIPSAARSTLPTPTPAMPRRCRVKRTRPETTLFPSPMWTPTSTTSRPRSTRSSWRTSLRWKSNCSGSRPTAITTTVRRPGPTALPITPSISSAPAKR